MATGDPVPWAQTTSAAARAALERAAVSPVLKGLSARPYELALDGTHLLGLEVRLGPAHRKPGWSTHAILELTAPAHPNLGVITVLDRRDTDGLPFAGPRDPVLTVAQDTRLVLRFIPVVRQALAGLDGTGRSRSIAVIRNPGRTTLADALVVPLWVALLLRGRAWRTQLALIIVDFAGFERTARVMARLVGRHGLHLFPATREPSSAPMRLPATAPGRPPGVLDFSGATDQGIAVAVRYLERHRNGGSS